MLDIDLMWHTHMAHSGLYRADCARARGHTVREGVGTPGVHACASLQAPRLPQLGWVWEEPCIPKPRSP